MIRRAAWFGLGAGAGFWLCSAVFAYLSFYPVSLALGFMACFALFWSAFFFAVAGA